MKFLLQYDLVHAPFTEVDVKLVGVRLVGAAADPVSELEARLKALDAVYDKDVPQAPAAFDAYVKQLTDSCGPLFPWLGGTVQPAFAYTEDVEGPDRDTPPPDDGAQARDAELVGFPVAAFGLTDESLLALRRAALADLARQDAPDRSPRTNRFTTAAPFALTGLANDQPQEIEEVGDVPRFSYGAFLAGLASLPGPIPHGQLNLCQFATYQPPAADPGKRVMVICAPVLTLTNGITREPDWAATQWKRYDTGAVKGLMAIVRYVDVPGEPDIEVRCRAIDPNEGEIPDSFLDRNTLWVRTSHASSQRQKKQQRGTPVSEGIAFEDWLGKLPERLAGAFDLPQLLLQLVERDANASRHPFAEALIAAGENQRPKGARALVDAMLLALRDVVGPGCVAEERSKPVKGPNGAPAPTAILNFVNEIVVETGSTGLTAAALQDLAGKILDADYTFRTAEDGREPWFKILAHVLAGPLDLPDNAAGFAETLASQVAIAPQASGAFDPGPLRRLIDAALLPANAANLQLAVWKEAGAPEVWLNAARSAFDVLAVRGFRLVELLRRANIDFPWVTSAGIWRRGEPTTKKDDEPPAKDTDLLQENILRTLVGYVHGTLCASPDTTPGAIEAQYEKVYRRQAKIPKTARRLVEDGIAELYGDRIGNWFPLPTDEGQGVLSAGLAPDAHGVALQIDRLIEGNEQATSDIDVNEDLAGYGLLMRRVAPHKEPWRCLTAAWAHINPDLGAVDLTFLNNSRMVLGALPVTYTAQMPQAIVIYDNRPIVGDDLSQKPDVELADADPRILRLYQPTTAAVGEDDPAILPFLAYGAVFEVAPFGISNHGAMPVEIRADYPAILDPARLTKDFVPPHPRRFVYLRRTGHGALRPKFGRQEKTYHPLLFPKDVKPLAEEILVPEGAITFPQNKSAATLKPVKARTALLLADKSGNALGTAGEMTLEIEAPVTTIEDFDRWIALDELLLTDAVKKQKSRQFRKDLRTRIQHGMVTLQELELDLGKARKDRNETKEKDLRRQIDGLKTKLALQDPSVTKLVVVATRLRRDGRFFAKAIDETEVVFFPWQWAWDESMSADDPFKDKRKPIKLMCKVDSVAAKVFTKADDTTGNVWVKGGDVVLVRCFAAVPESLLTDQPQPAGNRRFDSSVLKKGGPDGGRAPTYTNPGDRTTYALFSLYELAVEAAWPGLPADTEIGDDRTEIVMDKAVAGSVVPPPGSGDEQPGAVRLAFTRRKPGVAMDAIGSMTVGSQAWRWTGRPLAPFPFHRTQQLNALPPTAPDAEKPPAPSDYAFLWDVEGFAERLDETLDDEIARVPITETFVGDDSTPQQVRIALRTPSRERLARYMRFRIVAHNRYASAYRAAGYKESLESSRKAMWVRQGADVGDGWKTDWFRILRPAALPRLDVPAELPPPIVPKPGIRAVLPLTRAIRRGAGETPDPVSGVLVIVDGAWFEHAGLADWMLGRVEVARRSGETAAELGPDPLLRTYGLGGSVQKPAPAGLIDTVPLELAGPLGHSFDTGTATPLFLNSSFVVRAPGLVRDGILQDAAAWWMGKLAFRRMILVEGTRDYWSGVHAGPYLLASDQTAPQASASFHEVKATGANAEFRLALSGELAGAIAVPLAAISVAARRSKDGWSFEVNGTPVLGLAIAEPADEPKFDLRVVAARRVSEDPSNKSRLFAWYEILLMVRPWNKAWMSIWEGRQFEDKPGPGVAAKLRLELKTDRSKNVTFDYRDSQAFQVSEVTEGRWAQFLPNAETLARASAVPLDSLSLSVVGDKLRLSTKTGGALVWLGTDALVGKRAAGKTDQGLFNLLLLTRRVASVAGTEEEAYVGLYYSDKGYGPNEERTLNAAVDLEWFGQKKMKDEEPKLTGDQELIGRILTVRVGNLAKSAKDAGVWKKTLEKWKEQPWQQVFPDERESAYEAPLDGSQVFGEKRAGDAALQIIEIYAPIRAGA